MKECQYEEIREAEEKIDRKIVDQYNTPFCGVFIIFEDEKNKCSGLKKL